jgi:hypothetical protein
VKAWLTWLGVRFWQRMQSAALDLHDYAERRARRLMWRLRGAP